MESLERLPNIVRLSERVVRVLGLNPGKFTLQGTNTYLIGKGPRKVLLDTGEGIPEYISLLQTALDKELAGATISKVICSHWHHDHVGGVSDVLQFLAARNIRLEIPPAPIPPLADAGVKDAVGLVNVDPSSIPPEVFKYPDPEHDDPETRFQRISDQQVIQVDDETTLLTLHTPGHTADHCSFYLKEENTLFTADCVLGQGTAVFEDFSSYIKSLEKQLNFTTTVSGQQQQQPSYKIYPGHGPVIEDGPSKIREYIKHRLDRERQIMGVLSSSNNDNSNNNNNNNSGGVTAAESHRASESLGIKSHDGDSDRDADSSSSSGSGNGKTAMQIVAVIYAAYPVSLHAAAEHQVLLHLKKLEQEGRIRRRQTPTGEISDAVWEPVQQTQASL
ncbi:hypothetical protein BGZ99_001749 [Dissophora globulifera]|uniref:Metallo-beta-lactamase domain-containing protein n=1 Tax=Dissophora globulifera TaxID=979702 RepID=A0A9P6RNH6_9FUNG|nr:hypothetical protein BGZ99_001749 [Dissophora globulifera]